MTSDDSADSDQSGQDWGGLEIEESIAVGVLAELTQIRRALETIAYGQVQEDRQESSQDDVDRPVYECTSCTARVEGVRAAQEHAAAEHGAPGDGETWQHLMELVES